MAWVLFAHLECHPPIDGNIPDDSGGATRPENLQLDGCIVVAQPKMEDEIVLITLPGAGLHLSSENASVRQRQPDLSPDCGEVDLFSGIAEEADFQPVVVSGGTIHEKLACGHEIEISVVVKVSPGGLVGGWQALQLAVQCGIRKLEIPVIAKEHGIVFPSEAGRAVDGGEEEVHVSIIVEVGGRWAGVGFLVEYTALAPALERVFAIPAQVAQPQ